MANRRMIRKDIVDSDVFLDMPHSAQSLYFHLALRADDDGFVDNPRRIIKEINVNDDDLRILIAKGYLYWFDGGIVVITHWRIHNTLAKDRYHPSIHTVERGMLRVLENKAYSLDAEQGLRLGSSFACIQDDNRMLTDCVQDDNGLLTACVQNDNKLSTESKSVQSREEQSSLIISLSQEPKSILDCISDVEYDELQKKLSPQEIVYVTNKIDNIYGPNSFGSIKHPYHYFITAAINCGFLPETSGL